MVLLRLFNIEEGLLSAVITAIMVLIGTLPSAVVFSFPEKNRLKTILSVLIGGGIGIALGSGIVILFNIEEYLYITIFISLSVCVGVPYNIATGKGPLR